MVADRSPAVTLDRVAKIFPGKTAPALDDLSVAIEPGQFVAVIGKSGAGKTTLLRCLSRAMVVTQGAIRFDEIDLAELRGAALRAHRTRVGMIYQQFNLVRRLPVVDNVLIGRLGRLTGWSRWGRSPVTSTASSGPSRSGVSITSGWSIGSGSAPTRSPAASSSAWRSPRSWRRSRRSFWPTSRW